MKNKKKKIYWTGGKCLIQCLLANYVERVFFVPGESYLAVLDALYDVPEIESVICRHESGAAYMADAYGKLTGRPGVCFVTRGPGALNASGGVHIAAQDSTPLILFVGQVSRNHSDREAFQEIDCRQIFGQMAKWVAQIEDATRMNEYVHRAFQVAISGRPGPVVLSLPEDMLGDYVVAQRPKASVQIEAHPGPSEMKRLKEMMSKAKKPIAIIGGGGWNQRSVDDFRIFAEKNYLPVACAFRRQDHFPNDHKLYAGDVGIGINPKLAQYIKKSDLLLVVGPRLGEMTTSGYTLINIPQPKQSIIHVYPGAEELGRVYQADLMINAGMKAFARRVRDIGNINCRWSNHAENIHKHYLAWTKPKKIPGRVQMGKVMTWLRESLPREAILTNGAGNFSIWCNRFYRYRRLGTLLGPTSGTMGYGVPAAVAAALQHRTRIVIAFAGDGDFLMNCQELATAVQYNLKIIVLIINNGMYGTIRMHQERNYPGRIFGTELSNPNFCSLAKAFGAHGEIVESTDEFAPAFERALSKKISTVIDIRIDPNAILPSTTLDAIRSNAQNMK